MRPVVRVPRRGTYLGLPARSLYSKSFGWLHQYRFTIGIVFELRLKRRTNDMFRRGSVDVLGICTYERLPATGDDVGGEAVGAQVLHHFEELRLTH